MNFNFKFDNFDLIEVIGYILLIPPLLSVIYFTGSLFGIDFNNILDKLPYGNALISSLPVYLGLMAIAGAYLIKPNRN